MVQEKHYAPALVGLWKIPTGFILEVGFLSLENYLIFSFYLCYEIINEDQQGKKKNFYSFFSVHFIRQKRSPQEL